MPASINFEERAMRIANRADRIGEAKAEGRSAALLRINRGGEYRYVSVAV